MLPKVASRKKYIDETTRLFYERVHSAKVNNIKNPSCDASSVNSRTEKIFKKEKNNLKHWQDDYQYGSKVSDNSTNIAKISKILNSTFFKFKRNLNLF